MGFAQVSEGNFRIRTPLFLCLVGMSTVDRDVVVNGRKRTGNKTGRRKERTKIRRMHEGAALT